MLKASWSGGKAQVVEVHNNNDLNMRSNWVNCNRRLNEEKKQTHRGHPSIREPLEILSSTLLLKHIRLSFSLSPIFQSFFFYPPLLSLIIIPLLLTPFLFFSASLFTFTFPSLTSKLSFFPLPFHSFTSSPSPSSLSILFAHSPSLSHSRTYSHDSFTPFNDHPPPPLALVVNTPLNIPHDTIPYDTLPFLSPATQ